MWWFQRFFISTPALGNVPIWRSYFSTFVLQPPRLGLGLANDYAPVDRFHHEIAVQFPGSTNSICNLGSGLDTWELDLLMTTYIYIYIHIRPTSHLFHPCEKIVINSACWKNGGRCVCVYLRALICSQRSCELWHFVRLWCGWFRSCVAEQLADAALRHSLHGAETSFNHLQVSWKTLKIGLGKPGSFISGFNDGVVFFFVQI